MSDTLRLSLACALGLIGTLVCGLNLAYLVRSRRRGRFHSRIPLVGALFFGGALALIPATRAFCWAAVLLDLGTLELFAALPRIVRELRVTSRANLVAEYRAVRGAATVALQLFRANIFILKVEIVRVPVVAGIASASMTGTWSRDGTRLTLLTTDRQQALLEPASPADPESWRVVAGFPQWEAEPDLSLVGLTLVRSPANVK